MIGVILAFVGAHWLTLALAVLAFLYRLRWKLTERRMQFFKELHSHGIDQTVAARAELWDIRAARR